MKKIKLLIADDHGLIRDGINAMLKSEKDIEVAGEAENGLEAVVMVEREKPDVILMDIMMPKMSGIDALKKIKAADANAKVILMSMEISEEFISEALEHGVSGYLPKDVRKATLVKAIKQVHDGEEYFDAKVSEAIFKNYYKKKTKTTSVVPGAKLSKREEEVLLLVCQGLGNKEISEKLFISPRTVDSHKTHILEKLELNNTVELIKFAIKNGFIEL